jgi:hypothetical protein
LKEESHLKGWKIIRGRGGILQYKMGQWVCCLLVWCICSSPFLVHAEDPPTGIGPSVDAIKGGADIPALKKLENRRFVPVPVPISNPTIGSGLEFGLLYLWPRKEDQPDTPQSISGVGGLYTSNPCWAVGLVHQGFYAGDKIRISGLLGYGDFNLKFYGIGADSNFRDDPLDYKSTFTFFHPQARFRFPYISRDLFIGLGLFYLDANVSFESSDISSILPDLSLEERSVGLGPILTYDSRDDVHWPSKGTWLDFSVFDFDKGIGSNFNFWRFILKWEQNFPLTESLVLQYRYDGQYVDGHTPFYLLPNIHLRGFPQGLYADNLAMTLQGQLRWDILDKWTLMFFGGGGRVGDDLSDLGSNSTEYAGGIGFRYMIAPASKISIGCDFAYGEDGFAFYVEVGDVLSH